MAFKVFGPDFIVILAVGVWPLLWTRAINLLEFVAICIGGILAATSDFLTLSMITLAATFFVYREL